MFALIAALPFVGGLVGKANRVLVEVLAWLAVAVAVAVAGTVACERVYDRGVAAEHGQTLAARAERDGWKARALQAEATAADNEASALALGQQLSENADTFDRADADRYTAALDAARAARCEIRGQAVPDAVHRALTGPGRRSRMPCFLIRSCLYDLLSWPPGGGMTDYVPDILTPAARAVLEAARKLFQNPRWIPEPPPARSPRLDASRA